MNTKIVLTYLLLVVILTSCTAPRELLESGDFERAYRTALSALEENKNVAENQQVLVLALDTIIAQHTKEKQAYWAAADLGQKEKVFKVNERLRRRLEKSAPYWEERYTGLLITMDAEEEEWKAELSAAYFTTGEEKLAQATQLDNKAQAQAAYWDFKRAQSYGYLDIRLDTLLAESFDKGQLVYLIETDALSEIMYRWEIDRQFEDIVSYREHFLQVYYDGTPNGVEVDCHIELDFGSLDVDTEKEEETMSFTEEVVVGTEMITNAEGEEVEVDQLEEVTGTVIVTTITQTASWTIDVELPGGTAHCDLWRTSITEKLEYEVEEISTTGDERAIPAEYLDPVEVELLDEDEIADELLERLYEQVAAYLFET